MISNKVRRNIWLSLAILSLGTIVDRAIRVSDGTAEWWNLASAIVITALCIKFYLCYRRQVKEGNIFGKVNPLKKYNN